MSCARRVVWTYVGVGMIFFFNKRLARLKISHDSRTGTGRQEYTVSNEMLIDFSLVIKGDFFFLISKWNVVAENMSNRLFNIFWVTKNYIYNANKITPQFFCHNYEKIRVYQVV